MILNAFDMGHKIQCFIISGMLRERETRNCVFNMQKCTVLVFPSIVSILLQRTGGKRNDGLLEFSKEVTYIKNYTHTM